MTELLDAIPKAQTTKEHRDKQNLVRIQTFCTSENITRKCSKNERTPQRSISDKRYVQSISQLNKGSVKDKQNV